MLIKLEHKKSYFVLFSVIHVGIAHPELANSSLGVLELEVNQTKTQGLRIEVRIYKYCKELS